METPKGKLIPIGSFESTPEKGLSIQDKDFRKEILEDILAEIKKPDPKVEIIPFAGRNRDASAGEYTGLFSELGINAGVISAKNRKELDSETYLARLKNADCVFITGGDQVALKEAIEGTVFLEMLKRRYTDEDFVIAGTGAGAIVLSEYMISIEKSDESVIKGNISLTEGLEFLPGTIIDTHFLKRGRISRLTEALLMKRDCTGIGICENSGVVISEGNEIRSIGSGSVTIIEIYEIGDTNYDVAGYNEPVFVENLKMHLLSRGAKYYLKEKKIVVLEESLAETRVEAGGGK